ncbi:DUF1415 domain-containing protein [Litchfieldella xinjiangensis]|uniref:DUF1415 domain-containing protein n=1 Tax=Litchfieldella xinjiangensis TaxID=1166948 RepID=UPI0005B90E9F|nr:DUF1415 domain-containing protein [Halomonas xinjiangensis]
MSPSEQVIAATREWVSSFVVGHNICPFAGREVRRETIRYTSVTAEEWEPLLAALLDECRRLDNEADIATTLLIVESGLEDFETYLDLLAVAEALLVDQGYEGIYQLASFHPEYRFAGAPDDDPANYTNRSPWPMLHLLREAELEQVLIQYPDPEAIPERNILALQAMGEAPLRKRLASLRHPESNA